MNARDVRLLTFLSMAAVHSAVLSANDGLLKVKIVDERGNLTPARAWLVSGDQRLFEPHEALATPYRQDQSFSCDGSFSISVPAGPGTIYVEKGKEYLPVKDTVEITSGDAIEHEVRLQRWINMAELGWYSADLHVHLGYDQPRVLRQLALADDVNLIPAFTYWLRGTEKAWNAAWPAASFNQPEQIDQLHIVTRNNIEIERIHRTATSGGSVGATFLFNLRRPVTAQRFGEHFPTDADLCEIAREASPDSVFDSDKPSWAETVVGAALGQLDTIQLCHNHYNRNRTLPGGWGMIGPLAPGEFNQATGDGLFHRTNALYYRLLNCGFRLGVSGGSAIGVMPAPTGFNRVYAKIEGPLTSEKMWRAIKSGRTFATTGPMLWLSVRNTNSSEEFEVGGDIQFEKGTSVELAIRSVVRAIEKIESLQLVHNGLVVHSVDLRSRVPEPAINAALEHTLNVSESGWICARALYRASDGLLREAHTSPIYFSEAGEPLGSAADARYMLQWIDRLASVANQNPSWFSEDQDRDSLLATYERARDVYQQIIDSDK